MVLENSEVPEDCRLFKEKWGERTECKNCRGISLIRAVGKIFAGGTNGFQTNEGMCGSNL